MSHIIFRWQDNSNGEDGHYVYRSIEPMGPDELPPPVATLGADVEEFVDETFTDESPLAETLYYRVSSYKGSENLVSEEMSIPNPANVFSPNSPAWIFGDGEAGFANVLGLDTLFTDAAGTTPVVNYGDAIALATNLSGNGPDMVQATGAERLVYGRMPNTGTYPQVRNILTNTERFESSFWDFISASAVDNVTQAPDGTMTAAKLVEGASSGPHNIRKSLPFVAGVAYTQSIYIKAAERSWARLHVGTAVTGTSIGAYFDLANGVLGTVDAGVTANISNEGGGWYRISAQVTAANSGTAQLFTVLPATGDGSYQYTGDGTSGVYIWGAQIDEGPLTDYQRVGAGPYDVTESGVPSVNIAYSDTSDDNWSWDLAAGTYHIFVAGEKGSYFDEVTHAGGEFTVGPTTWTGGPEGAVTDLIGQRYVLLPVVLDRAFTDYEKAQLVAYAVAKGCPGVWNESAELVANGGFATDLSGWTNANTYWQWSSGRAYHPPGDVFNTLRSSPIASAQNQLALVEYEFEVQSGQGRAQYRTVSDDPSSGGGPRGYPKGSTGGQNSGVYRYISRIPADADSLAISRNQPETATEFYVDNVSVRKLTLESAPTPSVKEYPPIPPEELDYDGYYTLTLTAKSMAGLYNPAILDENYPPAEGKAWMIGTLAEPGITVTSVDGVIPGTLTKADEILTDNIFYDNDDPGSNLSQHHFDFVYMVIQYEGVYIRDISISHTTETGDPSPLPLGATLVGVQANGDYVTEDSADDWISEFGSLYAGHWNFDVVGRTYFGSNNLPEKLSDPDTPITVRVYYKLESE